MTEDAHALASLPELNHPTVSPDGRRVAYCRVADGTADLRVVDVETGDRETWASGLPASPWPLWWDAHGERVLYPYATDGAEQNDVYAVDGDGDLTPLVETTGTTNVRGVAPDGETLLLGSNHEGGMDLYAHDLASDETIRLTDTDHPVWTSRLSPEGDRVAYPTEGRVVVRSLDGDVQQAVEVGDPDSTTLPADWGPEGERLLLTDDATDADRAGVYDLAPGEVTWYGQDDHVEEAECFLPGGERLVATRKRDAVTLAVVVDVETGASRELALRDGVVDFGLRSHRVVDGDRLLLTYSTPTQRPELVVYDLASDERRVLVEAAYGPFEPSDFVAPDYRRVESDGVPETRQAAVEYDPYDSLDVGTLFYDAGVRPSPLVVFPHGGPHLSDRREFDRHVQYLCHRGYSVLRVNYRGSSGRGRSFARRLRGDWAGAEQGDVATAAERTLAARDWLDDDRVAVYGGSYGGYSAYWQVVQYPDLYDAGVAVVGKTDLVAMYEQTVPQFREGYMQRYVGTPAENPDLYEERSPVTHAANLDCPLLVVHGTNDPRVPVSQARRFRDRLRELGYERGRDFEYRELEGSGHFGGEDDDSGPLALAADFLDRRL